MSDRAGGHRLPSFGLPLAYFQQEQGAALIAAITAISAPRMVVALAGGPGSGKSTLAEGLVAALPDAVLVPMDGFHLDDPILSARGLLARKGAVETFDAAGFAVLAARLSVPGAEVVYPVFDRDREISVAGAGIVRADHRIVVIEGNYLLLDRAPWSQVRYDLTVALEVPEAELRRRLTARWQALGRSDEAVAAHLKSDLANARFVTRHSRSADRVLVLQEAHQEPGQP